MIFLKVSHLTLTLTLLLQQLLVYQRVFSIEVCVDLVLLTLGKILFYQMRFSFQIFKSKFLLRAQKQKFHLQIQFLGSQITFRQQDPSNSRTFFQLRSSSSLNLLEKFSIPVFQQHNISAIYRIPSTELQSRPTART
ncbi:Hypothetical_protein [Hexamita inflata]|uniref:Hypothetical_protein n=1 Tax=Hexamita inflata TaxID=28002 RepID=A0AA86UEQ3_9EUKA|nr:Hypothetical protein HINF_LOCUS40439 [Hexamita inflata]